jgi:pachytene checkpoint protein 2
LQNTYRRQKRRSRRSSQQAVANLFEQTLPELAMDGVAIVLLDEVETLAASRHRLSLEANPIDVHRATDAALAGMDRLTRDYKNILVIATTNFLDALDSAVLSRADHIEPIDLPNAIARQEIIADTFRAIGGEWKKVRGLEEHIDRLAKVADGLDGRRIRKSIVTAIASDIETAKDPNRLTISQVETSFRQALKAQKGPTK